MLRNGKTDAGSSAAIHWDNSVTVTGAMIIYSSCGSSSFPEYETLILP